MTYKGFEILREKHTAGGRTFYYAIWDAEGFLIDCTVTPTEAIETVDNLLSEIKNNNS